MPTIPATSELMKDLTSDPTIIAIDPGATGGIAILWPNGAVALKSMPDTEQDVWNYIFMAGAFGSNTSPLTGAPKRVACIEWINPAIQGIAKGPMSKLYGSYMSLRMVLTACGIPFETVMPQKWQKELGIPKRLETENRSKWKGRLKAKAQQLYPSASGLTLDTADALLIAEYYRRTRK